MKDVAHEKFAKLMEEIEELESRLEEKESEELREQLIEKRNELQRLSDGCGHPHHH
jgi:hypothetical protein